MWLSTGCSPCGTAVGWYPSKQSHVSPPACAESPQEHPASWQQGSQGHPFHTSHLPLTFFLFLLADGFCLVPWVTSWHITGLNSGWICWSGVLVEHRSPPSPMSLSISVHLLGLCFSLFELGFELSVAFKLLHLKIDFHRKLHLFYYAWRTFIY